MAEPSPVDAADESARGGVSEDAPTGPLPEFRIVVKHPNRGGPLAPFRLLIVVAVVAIAVGPALWATVSGGQPDDGVLIRAGLIGLLVWVTTGIVSAALGSAESAPGPSSRGADRP